MVTKIQVSIGSGSGLLPDGTKSLPEPMLTYHHMFCGISLRAISQEVLMNFTSNMYSDIAL